MSIFISIVENEISKISILNIQRVFRKLQLAHFIIKLNLEKQFETKNFSENNSDIAE